MAEAIKERKKLGFTGKVLLGIAGLALATSLVVGIPRFFKKPEPITNPQVATAVQEKKPRIWCGTYEPLHEKLVVYVENKGEKAKGREIGAAFLVGASAFFDNTQPLAYTCRENGKIWWVSNKAIYDGVLSPDDINCCDIVDVRKISYALLPEYKAPNILVIGAAILWPLTEAMPYIATITNDGFLQVFSPPLKEPTITEKFVINMQTAYTLDDPLRWPNGIESARLGVLKAREFVIIPIGNAHSDDVHVFYYISYSGSLPYKGGGKDGLIWPLDLRERSPDLKTVTSASPIIYDKERGGWVSLITGVTKSDNEVYLPTIVKPLQVLEEERAEELKQDKQK